MRSQHLYSAIVTAVLTAAPAIAQTYTTCNPLTSGSCPPDTALGKSVNIDFTQGASDSFTSQGNPTYDSSGAKFTVAKSGDSPQLISKWYIMFGHVDFVMKPAPGVGVVSSAVLQSDDLDEIDWEWLGGDAQQVQSNYFGKGQTTTYNRGAFHANPNNQAAFHKYSIDWTADEIAWQIDGKTVRTLTPQTAQAGQYPQTPMMIKIGAWSGGDSSNAPGTIAWAGGPTNYASGPYTMDVSSIAVTDYSTGTQYTYSGTDGTWQSIKSNGGTIKSSGNGAAPVAAAPPAVTSTSNSAPMPFEGTHRDPTVTSTPNAGGWTPTTMQTSASVATTAYPGLPSGWTVTSSGKVVPPSAAPSPSQPISPMSSPAASPQASSLAAGAEVVTEFNGQGFPVTVTQAAGQAKSYDNQGFLVTNAPVAPASSPTGVAKAADSITSPSSSGINVIKVINGAAPMYPEVRFKILGAACLLAGVLVL